MSRKRSGASVTAVSAVASALGLLVLVVAAPASSQEGRSDHVITAASPPPGAADTLSTVATTGTTAPDVGTLPASEVVDPRPVSVTASSTVVGAGGVVTFRGVCPDPPSAELVVAVIGPAGEQVVAELVEASWVFEWVAPVDPARFGSHSFQFWCDDAAGPEGQYPESLLLTVDMVAQAAATTTTPAPPIFPTNTNTTTTTVEGTTPGPIGVLPATS